MMADFVYNNAYKQFADGAWAWTGLAVNAALVTGAYVPQRTHVNLSEVTPAALVVRDQALTGLGVRDTGVCYGAVPRINAVSADAPVVGFVLYVKGVDDASSPLIYYSSGGAGFPFTAAGLNWQIAYDQTVGGFFQV